MEKIDVGEIFSTVSVGLSVTLRNVKLSYEGEAASAYFSLLVDNLIIEGGTIHCIYGTNGCGKTSLLKVLAKVTLLKSGSVQWSNLQEQIPGKDYVFVTQAGPWPHWSVWQNIYEPQLEAGISHEHARSRAYTVIDCLGLNELEGRFAHQLSAGQQQRTVLARALVLSPKILLLDEIMSGQSEYWAERIAGILRSFAARGGMVIMVSHDPEWVMTYADRVTHIVSSLGDAVSSAQFFCGYDGDGRGWVEFRQQRLKRIMKVNK